MVQASRTLTPYAHKLGNRSTCPKAQRRAWQGSEVWARFLLKKRSLPRSMPTYPMNSIKKNILTLAVLASFAPYMSTAHIPEKKQEQGATKRCPCLQTLQGHTNIVWSISYAPHNTNPNHGIRLIQGYHRQRTNKRFLPKVITGLIGTYTQRETIVAASGTKVTLWDTSLGKCLRTFQGHTGYINDVCYAPDGATLASASNDESVKLWNAQTGTCLRTLLGHTKSVWSVRYAPHGKTLASASADRLIKIWDVSNGAYLHTLQGHTLPVLSICYAPNGENLASGGDDLTIKIWHAASGQCLRTITGHTSFVYSVCYSPDGRTLASASGQAYNFLMDEGYGKVKIWNPSSGACLLTLTGHAASVLRVCYAPDGKTLASAGEDKAVKIWDTQTGACLHTLTGHRSDVNSVCYASDGQTLASASSDKTIKIWKACVGSQHGSGMAVH